MIMKWIEFFSSFFQKRLGEDGDEGLMGELMMLMMLIAVVIGVGLFAEVARVGCKGGGG